MANCPMIALPLLLTLTLVAPAASAASYTVTEKPTLGFKWKDGSCRLGEKIESCLAALGPSYVLHTEKNEANVKAYLSDDVKSYVYAGEGLAVTSDAAGVVLTVTFYLNGSKAIGTFPATKPCRIKTDRGIARGATLMRLDKVYGAPYRFRKDTLLHYGDLESFYSLGQGYLSFGFKDGELDTIGIHSKYQEFINAPEK